MFVVFRRLIGTLESWRNTGRSLVAAVRQRLDVPFGPLVGRCFSCGMCVEIQQTLAVGCGKEQEGGPGFCVG